MRHLVHMASFSAQTNMHARNLAIVWAPNLLRWAHAGAGYGDPGGEPSPPRPLQEWVWLRGCTERSVGSHGAQGERGRFRIALSGMGFTCWTRGLCVFSHCVTELRGWNRKY